MKGKDNEKDFSILLLVGYQVFKDFPAKFLPNSKWVKAKLETAGMRISYLVYMSSMLFWTIMATVLTFALLPLLDLNAISLYISFLIGSSSAVLPPLAIHALFTILAGVTTMAAFYTYPLYVAGKIKRGIEKNLVHITNYMAIMASGGATAEEIFTSLAKVGKVFGIQDSGESIVRSVDFLGQDIMSAIDIESKRTPSKEYASFLQGFIATIRKGGDLKSYLAGISEKSIEDRRRQLAKMLTSINFVAEVFIIVLVAFPIVIMVLLSVMQSFSGSMLGGLSAIQIMNLVTYLAVPFAAAGVLFFIDMMMEGSKD